MYCQSVMEATNDELELVSSNGNTCKLQIYLSQNFTNISFILPETGMEMQFLSESWDETAVN